MQKTPFKFPADFIAEGQDQTRGWFYTLMVLGTALFKNTPYYNVIVNGIILAEDGKKMSKRLKNYPDPMYIVEKYGADSMRFYLMSSPAVQAQELRFSEKGVEEVMRKVILPLWNTYYFFTTYANIDRWSPENSLKQKKGELPPQRGGHNVQAKLSSASNIFKTAIKVKRKGKNNLKEINEKIGDIRVDGKYLHNHFYKKSKKEAHKRIKLANVVLPYLDKINFEDNVGYVIFKNLVIRVILGEDNNGKYVKTYYVVDWLTKLYSDNELSLSNPLDKWIISELNLLIKNVTKALDDYTLMPATRYIVDFLDNLTNWYIRRSRRRFWKSENDSDKMQAYTTLHEVLVKLSQVLAPFSPFITDYIYQDLTKEESVHLSDWPEYDEGKIDEKLNQEMQLAKNIVSLGLSWRARNKIRVRQPLNWVKITKQLPEYYKDIIKEELNVKDVIVSTDLAKEIAKPEGRKIGPKYGKAVQAIIKNAKEGNFEKIEDGKIVVHTDMGDFTLLPDEYTIEFIPQDESLDLESGFGIVVALDKNITEDLLLEGYARDIVRFVQEARKNADYHVADRIKVSLFTESEEIKKALSKFKEYIEKETLSTIVDDIDNPDYETEVDIEGYKLKIKLKK